MPLSKSSRFDQNGHTCLGCHFHTRPEGIKTELVFKSCPQGSGGTTIEETIFTFAYMIRYFKNLFKNQFTRKAEIYLKAFRHSIKANLLK
jgi:hypothetical protein